MIDVFIDSEFITLGQLLKLIGVITNGGEAKIALLTLKIQVNGTFENRRGRKIRPGDKVFIGKKGFLIQKNDY